MFTSKKNLQLIDYKNSYYCQQQRKKRRYKWFKISVLLLLIISLALVFMPYAQSEQLDSQEQIKRGNVLVHGPQLLFENPNNSQSQNPNIAVRATFPVDIEANIEINGLVAYAEIKQTFINPYNIALAGKYQFPLPENSAVKQLMIKMGNVEILGEIMEKKAAKAIYQKAKKKGRKASLVEQQRPNLFTNKIANIPAQSTVVVTLKFIMPVSFSQGKFNLRLPLALTDRYQPRSTSNSFNESSGHSPEYSSERSPSNFTHDLTNVSANISTKSLPEPFKISTTRSSTTHVRSVARSQSSINIVLNSGIPITSIVSDSHKIQSRDLSSKLNSEQNAYFITLDKTQVISNKTFDLTWQLIASNQPQVSSFTQEISGEHYTLLTFFPPEKAVAQVIARDIIFIIDTSGSMQAGSMEQAKSSLQLALLQLNNKDSFNIIAFDNDTELLFPVTHMASAHNISKAQQFIDGLSANGGTEMYRPLSNALMMKKDKTQSSKAIRQIVFITDGAVANEFELMQLLNTAQGDFRLYTVGIGAAPNGYFMKKAAQFGRGSYVFIQNKSEVQRKMSHFMTKISQPALTNIALTLDNQIHQHVEVYPKKIPDLYFGEPLQIALKSQFPISSVQLTAETVSTPFYQQLIIDDRQPSKGISSLWARRKIESLVDSLIVGANKDKVKSQVIATSLNHQIISPYTSFIAVEKQPEVSSLLVKNDLSSVKKSKNNAIPAHESLLVAMPQTALDWQLQFLVGIALMLLSLVFMKIRNLALLNNIMLANTWLANKRFKLVNCNEKPH
ncbi:marine proteobacterial sortase target protein [Colwellia psychrerythraea]|uniref:von Willebrand factor type A domain protein n=1 Tax=Colwellia psychrerythraea (strain 34H / ATCC BAA-681) TaxID=167879 RepID=Q47YR5_COLP3|nr:marine proteobacterial sortase target protein [Colwellia psychrerythraea]AAZ26680.1 von Willebrand factor type A domain protein [Colwellia psychrerythraea 34H]